MDQISMREFFNQHALLIGTVTTVGARYMLRFLAWLLHRPPNYDKKVRRLLLRALKQPPEAWRLEDYQGCRCGTLKLPQSDYRNVVFRLNACGKRGYFALKDDRFTPLSVSYKTDVVIYRKSRRFFEGYQKYLARLTEQDRVNKILDTIEGCRSDMPRA